MPRVQINNVEIQCFSLSVASLRQVLENKASVSRARLEERNIIILCSIEEVLTMYSFIVNSFERSGNTTQMILSMKSIK